METSKEAKTAGNMEYIMLASKHNPNCRSQLTINPPIEGLAKSGYRARQARNTYHIASKGGDLTGTIEYTVFEKSIDMPATPKTKGILKTISVMVLPKHAYEMLRLAQSNGGFDGFAGYETL